MPRLEPKPLAAVSSPLAPAKNEPGPALQAVLAKRQFAFPEREAAAAIEPRELPTAALKKYVDASREALEKAPDLTHSEHVYAYAYEVAGQPYFAVDQHTSYPGWNRQASHVEIFDSAGRQVAEVLQSAQNGELELQGGATSVIRPRTDASFQSRSQLGRAELLNELSTQNMLARYRDQLQDMPAVAIDPSTGMDVAGAKCSSKFCDPELPEHLRRSTPAAVYSGARRAFEDLQLSEDEARKLINHYARIEPGYRQNAVNALASLRREAIRPEHVRIIDEIVRLLTETERPFIELVYFLIEGGSMIDGADLQELKDLYNTLPGPAQHAAVTALQNILAESENPMVTMGVEDILRNLGAPAA
jgi:hypothetical protein